MIEAELKARLTNPDVVCSALAKRAEPEAATYSDIYYDTDDGALEKDGRELRVRTITTGDTIRHELTYKEPVVDDDSQSKPEYESAVGSVGAVKYIVEQLGYVPFVSLTKDCTNYRFTDGGRDFLATVVRVPEIDYTFLEVETEIDYTFLEVETLATVDRVDAALAAVRSVLDSLGVSAKELTTETYTDAVRAARSAGA